MARDVKSLSTLMAAVTVIALLPECNRVASKSSEVSDSKEIITSKCQGTYRGTQGSYVKMNSFGEELIIEGEEVIVPAMDYALTLHADGRAVLEQSYKNGRAGVILNGQYDIIADHERFLWLDCALSDGTNPSLLYTVIFDKSSGAIIGEGAHEPPVKFTKVLDATEKQDE